MRISTSSSGLVLKLIFGPVAFGQETTAMGETTQLPPTSSPAGELSHAVARGRAAGGLGGADLRYCAR